MSSGRKLHQDVKFFEISGTASVPETLEILRVLTRLSACDISKNCLFVGSKCMSYVSSLIVTIMLYDSVLILKGSHNYIGIMFGGFIKLDKKTNHKTPPVG
jgi:hypothetical protein